jgi:predicted DNA-binding transcriptional regulator YafY
VSIKVFYTQELEQQIFSFGPDVEVISPLWLREQFIQRIKDGLRMYSLNVGMEG